MNPVFKHYITKYKEAGVKTASIGSAAKNILNRGWGAIKAHPKTSIAVPTIAALGTLGWHWDDKRREASLEKARLESAARIAESESASTRNKAIGYGMGSAALSFILLSAYISYKDKNKQSKNTSGFSNSK